MIKFKKIVSSLILTAFILTPFLYDLPVVKAANHDPLLVGLVGNWTFDEGSGTVAEDLSGNGNTGTIMNEPSRVPGISGGALHFDGVDDYVAIPDAANLSPGGGPYTLSSWFTTNYNQSGAIVSKRQTTNPWGQIALFLRPDPVITAWYRADDLNEEEFSTPYSYADGLWHLVTLVVENNTSTLYIDGIMQSSKKIDVGTPTYAGSEPLEIGRANPGTFFQGSIDDVRVYNRSLSAHEVRTLYEQEMDPTQVGQWSAPFDLPIVAVHSVLLHTGEVLMWDDEDPADVYLWNPSTNTFAQKPNFANQFCAGITTLADGRVFAIGGGQQRSVALKDANFFDPISRAWSVGAPMSYDRWYPTATTLSDGKVLAVSGGGACGGECLITIPELYNPETNLWTQLTNAPLTVPLYPFMFQLPNGKVAYTGSDEKNTETMVLDVATQTWTMVDPNIVSGGSAAMYRPGVIIKSGTPGKGEDQFVTPSVSSTYVIDMNSPAPAWRQVDSMAFPRAYHTLTLLPDGDVIATNGLKSNQYGDDTKAVHAAEIWDAQSESWSTMASQQVSRSYHSTSLLLPDGRILVAGSGRLPEMVNQLNAEIFSPPYLFKGARPVVNSTPASVDYGSSFFVGTPNSDIVSVALIRPGAITHSFDQNQRYVPLSFSQTSGGLTLSAPADGQIAPPGYYMLFLVNSAGVPSVASFVQLEADTTVPSVSIVNPQDGSFVPRRTEVNIQVSATDDTAVQRVEIALDGALLCSDTSAPYECSWSVPNAKGKTFVIRADAYDAANNKSSASIQVTAK